MINAKKLGKFGHIVIYLNHHHKIIKIINSWWKSNQQNGKQMN